jgi:hypothetical protein
MTRSRTDDRRFPGSRSALRCWLIGLACAVPLASAFAGDQDGGNWRERGQQPVWLWNSWRPGVYDSVPPVIYPALGYSAHPGQPSEAPPDNVSFPLSHH